MTTTCTMVLGDCLEVMPAMKGKVFDFCFADIPYAPAHTHCTRNPWDKHFPIDSFWQQLWAMMSPAGQLVMTANARLSATLISAWPRYFRYDLIWQKLLPVGFLDANRRPLRSHELILLFAKGLGTYNPIKTGGRAYVAKAGRRNNNYDGHERMVTANTGTRYPLSIIKPHERDKTRIHPTQKPVALLDWLIRTYTNAGDMVLDPTAGSFAACVSACSNGRSSVGIEKNEEYFDAGLERVRKHVRNNLLDVRLEVRK